MTTSEDDLTPKERSGDDTIFHNTSADILCCSSRTGDRHGGFLKWHTEVSFICNTINDLSDHNFAVVIDEAHSSQSGIAADKLNATVQKMIKEDGEMTTDAVIAELMPGRRMANNCCHLLK